jgi:hypothetical protein
MPDNEVDVGESQDESNGADGLFDLSSTVLAAAAQDSEEIEPNDAGRNGH